MLPDSQLETGIITSAIVNGSINAPKRTAHPTDFMPSLDETFPRRVPARDQSADEGLAMMNAFMARHNKAIGIDP
ncbi:hypothetical protein [Singulisphaera sp. PoT]|uniref:hypothetical protein n=1 Tax=Singulisphaera sp. PoT TaxID=3411797 RepID=UPI003BF5A709